MHPTSPSIRSDNAVFSPPAGRQRHCRDKKRSASSSPQQSHHRSSKVSRTTDPDTIPATNDTSENLTAVKPVENDKPENETEPDQSGENSGNDGDTSEVFDTDLDADLKAQNELSLKYKSDFARRVSLNSNLTT